MSYGTEAFVMSLSEEDLEDACLSSWPRPSSTDEVLDEEGIILAQITGALEPETEPDLNETSYQNDISYQAYQWSARPMMYPQRSADWWHGYDGSAGRGYGGSFPSASAIVGMRCDREMPGGSQVRSQSVGYSMSARDWRKPRQPCLEDFMAHAQARSSGRAPKQSTRRTRSVSKGPELQGLFASDQLSHEMRLENEEEDVVRQAGYIGTAVRKDATEGSLSKRDEMSKMTPSTERRSQEPGNQLKNGVSHAEHHQHQLDSQHWQVPQWQLQQQKETKSWQQQQMQVSQPQQEERHVVWKASNVGDWYGQGPDWRGSTKGKGGSWGSQPPIEQVRQTMMKYKYENQEVTEQLRKLKEELSQKEKELGEKEAELDWMRSVVAKVAAVTVDACPCVVTAFKSLGISESDWKCAARCRSCKHKRNDIGGSTIAPKAKAKAQSTSSWAELVRTGTIKRKEPAKVDHEPARPWSQTASDKSPGDQANGAHSSVDSVPTTNGKTHGSAYELNGIPHIPPCDLMDMDEVDDHYGRQALLRDTVNGHHEATDHPSLKEDRKGEDAYPWRRTSRKSSPPGVAQPSQQCMQFSQSSGRAGMVGASIRGKSPRSGDRIGRGMQRANRSHEDPPFHSQQYPAHNGVPRRIPEMALHATDLLQSDTSDDASPCSRKSS